VQQMIIERRFQGPSQSANGGYIAGALAELIDGPAEITLRSPPPLETPMDLNRIDGGYDLMCDGVLVGSVRPGEFELTIPAKPPIESIAAALPNYPGAKNSPIPHCFVCGVKGKVGEALRVFASPVEGHKMVAANWTPDDGLADPDGFLPECFVFAALDCPGAYAFYDDSEGSMLLGRIVGHVTGRVRAGDQCTVMAWREGAEGRKAWAGSAVLGPDDQVVASAYATWIRVPSIS
jgi:hypothetical protein